MYGLVMINGVGGKRNKDRIGELLLSAIYELLHSIPSKLDRPRCMCFAKSPVHLKLFYQLVTLRLGEFANWPKW